MQLPPQWAQDAWPKPNYVDPVTRGTAQIVVNLVLYPIVLLTILLRIYTRVLHLKVSTFDIDDLLILLAMIPTTAFFIISILADTHFMWRRHIYDIPISNIETGIKVLLTAEILFTVACTLCKLSMLFLIHRVLATATLFWRRMTLGTIWVVAMQGIAFTFAIIFQCRSPKDYWEVTAHPQPDCENPTALFLIFGIVNTLTDFLVVLLPIPTILKLDLPGRQTGIIIALFALGLFSSGAGISRTYFMYEVDITYDPTWIGFPVWITAAVELYLGLICASIPATKPFFSTYIPKLLSATTSYASRSKSPATLKDPSSNRNPKNLSITILSHPSSTTASPNPYYIHSPSNKTPKSPIASSSSSTTTKIGSPTSPNRTISSIPSRRHREDRDMRISLSSVISSENESRRREMEADFNFQYGAGIPEAVEDEVNEIELGDFVYMNFDHRSMDVDREDMVVQSGRNSYRSWEGGDDSRFGVLNNMSKEFERGLEDGFGGRASGVGGSGFKDFDLERGVP